MNNNAHIIKWLNLSIVVVILMVFIGGITRLTESGLSITHWKPITGILPPLNKVEWELQFNEYKKYPEYKELNINMSLSEYKKIYFWEYVHRILEYLGAKNI